MPNFQRDPLHLYQPLGPTDIENPSGYQTLQHLLIQTNRQFNYHLSMLF
jgi:hypothetical protein